MYNVQSFSFSISVCIRFWKNQPLKVWRSRSFWIVRINMLSHFVPHSCRQLHPIQELQAKDHQLRLPRRRRAWCKHFTSSLWQKEGRRYFGRQQQTTCVWKRFFVRGKRMHTYWHTIVNTTIPAAHASAAAVTVVLGGSLDQSLFAKTNRRTLFFFKKKGS